MQESYLAVPYAFGKLERELRSRRSTTRAPSQSFDKENVQLDEAIDRIRERQHARRRCSASENDAHYGWFWQLKKCRMRRSRAICTRVLAGHDFQEGLKNYRDLVFMGHTLDRWGDSMEAFGDMIDTREHAYAERLPRADALLARERRTSCSSDATSSTAASTTIESDARCGRAGLGGGARPVGAHPAARSRAGRRARHTRRTPSCATGCGS